MNFKHLSVKVWILVRIIGSDRMLTLQCNVMLFTALWAIGYSGSYNDTMLPLSNAI